MKLRATLIAVILLSCISAFAAEPAPKVRTEMLVSTAWLAEHLNDPNVVILHIGSDKAAYDSGHIPGARFLAVRDFTRQDPPGVELPNPQNVAMTFEALGVKRAARIVVYASDWQPNAARAWFTLDYLGLGDKAAMLDGGMEQWMIDDRPLSTKEAESPGGPFGPGGLPNIKKQADVVVYHKDVISLMQSDKLAAILDARPLSRYRAGHIPGAKSIFWERFLVSPERPVLKSPEELRRMLIDAGVSAGKKNVAYCEVGLQASFTYFILKYLGYDAYNYDGSFAEWSKTDAPIVRGDSAR
jgi:thiosulfate/3-mercaptopyruvate sulfurtransferase